MSCRWLLSEPMLNPLGRRIRQRGLHVWELQRTAAASIARRSSAHTRSPRRRGPSSAALRPRSRRTSPDSGIDTPRLCSAVRLAAPRAAAGSEPRPQAHPSSSRRIRRARAWPPPRMALHDASHAPNFPRFAPDFIRLFLGASNATEAARLTDNTPCALALSRFRRRRMCIARARAFRTLHAWPG